VLVHSGVSVLDVLAAVVFQLTSPSNDYWGEYGAYGACSRPCGTGVAMRIRQCITARTDGGNNCVGSSKSYRICNMQACPAGSRDFREEQCAQFSRMDFQSKRYTWLPYHGGAIGIIYCIAGYGPEERCWVPAVRNGEIIGMDSDVAPATPAANFRYREPLTYAYTYSAWSECSAPCNSGTQHRSVQCMVQDSMAPHVVDDSYCVSQQLPRPESQQACNQQGCAEYSVSSFSVCSVTCGDGQQTREVVCVGAGGERFGDHACSGLAHPPAVQACRKPACHIHIRWHVHDFGLCSRNCGGGVRERRVMCMDIDQNPYGEDRCAPHPKPATMEQCNTQACHEAQSVPSVHDPTGHDSTLRGYVPYDPSVYDPYSTAVVGPHCSQSYYGCCPDGHTSSGGHRGEECPANDCVRTRYGCCLDGVTPAQGHRRAGCPDYHPLASGHMCSLSHDAGPCASWTSRFYYNSATGSCTQFWFGGCQGNANNFVSRDHCQRKCSGAVVTPRVASPPARTVRVRTRARAYHVRS
uniref:Papilin b, proteoglycan-like sulfated glycoprotein n=1 Tax=Hucho hucho TaxID=62062 RepID=A0A4W5QXZ4_9TELE